MAHRKFKAFRMSEISAVDRPAQVGAVAPIWKRDATPPANDDGALYVVKGLDALPEATQQYAKRTFTQAQRDEDAKSGAAMSDGSFQIKNRSDLENAIRLAGHAKDPGKAKAHIIARARTLDATSMLPSGWSVGKSIGGDLVIEIARVAGQALPDLLEKVVFAEEISAQIEKIADKKVRAEKQREMKQANAALVASSWSVIDAAPADAVSLLQKNFAEYKDHAQGLVSGVIVDTNEVAKGADDMKGIAKQLGLPETATEADILKALADRDVAHAAALEKAAKKPKDPADEDDDMEKAIAKGTAFRTDGGIIIRKSDFTNDRAFNLAKATAEDAVIAKDAAATAVIAKRLEPITKGLVGNADDTAAILLRVTKGKSTKEDAAALEKMLVSANEIVVKSEQITKEIGGASGVSLGSAATAIQAKADGLVKADTTRRLTIEKARDQVRKSDPELAKQEAAERSAARRAA